MSNSFGYFFHLEPQCADEIEQGTRADPGFLRGAPTPTFSENCMKMKKIGPREVSKICPCRSATGSKEGGIWRQSRRYVLTQLDLKHFFISLHMWETTVMHKQVSGWTVNFGPNFPDQSLLRNTPPPQFRKLQIWDDQSLLWNTPPPPRKLKFRQILALCDFSVSESPPRKLKFRQILALCDFSVSEYTPLPKIEI